MFSKSEKKINELADSVKDKVESISLSDNDGLSNKASEVADKGVSAVNDLKGALKSKVESNPVGAVFVGAFIGLFLGVFLSKK